MNETRQLKKLGQKVIPCDAPIAISDKTIANLVSLLEKKVNLEYTYIWIDFGSTVYDMHVELRDTTSLNGESEDLYFEIKNNDLIGMYDIKGVFLSFATSQEVVDELMTAMQVQHEGKSIDIPIEIATATASQVSQATTL